MVRIPECGSGDLGSIPNRHNLQIQYGVMVTQLVLNQQLWVRFPVLEIDFCSTFKSTGFL